MNEHPIEGLMTTAMNSIQDMIDVNTIIGEPIETSNNVIIIPISKVSFGFAAGGSEFKGETIDEYSKKDKEEEIQYRLPFGGGSGAGVSINPIAFLVVQQDGVRLLPVNYSSAVDKLLDCVPDIMDKINVITAKIIKETKDPKTNKETKIDLNDKIKISKDKNEFDNKNIKTKQRKVRSIQTKNIIPEDKTSIEYEYDETNDENSINSEDYIDYSDDFDD